MTIEIFRFASFGLSLRDYSRTNFNYYVLHIGWLGIKWCDMNLVSFYSHMEWKRFYESYYG